LSAHNQLQLVLLPQTRPKELVENQAKIKLHPIIRKLKTKLQVESLAAQIRRRAVKSLLLRGVFHQLQELELLLKPIINNKIMAHLD